MTALERVHDYAPANPFDESPRMPGTVAVRTDQFERMGNWLDLFMRTAEVAKVLARTNFVPDAMKGEPENVAASMMRSLELGIDPLDGLQNMHVVKGKVGYSAEFMRRRILEAGHEYEFLEQTDERCKIRGRRDGTGEWQTVVFTADNARKAKINLGEYPADKLVARASSRLCRRVFPDVLAGAQILEDILDVEALEADPATSSPVQRKRQPRKVTAKRADTPEQRQERVDDIDELLGDDTPDTASEPDTKVDNEPDKSEPSNASPQADDDDLLDNDADTGTDDPITKPQLQKLSILRQHEGYADTDDGRTDWFQWVYVNIGRLVATNKDLTKSEASVLIDVLEEAQKQDAERK